MKANSSDRRTQLIRLIHVARRELGMDEDSYRQFLANIPVLEEATSCSKLSVPKLDVVLEQLKSKGFKVVPKNKKPQGKLANDPQSRLIRHLWLSLHTAGKVRDSSETALAKYVARLTKVDQLQWLNNRQATVVIESLKNWLERKG
jgi:phage gp16-like protein